MAPGSWSLVVKPSIEEPREGSRLNVTLRLGYRVPAIGQFDAQTSPQWDPRNLLDQIKSRVNAGIKVYGCYDCEAGACGYWFHRELIKAGAVFVVVPRPLENRRTT
jgi:hypothetical protein